jgi:hypothetical protein
MKKRDIYSRKYSVLPKLFYSFDDNDDSYDLSLSELSFVSNCIWTDYKLKSLWCVFF